ncbi:MAG: 1-(5-phosphoribosyl)-5-[(5-phosphoribosylamino)methylideneamino]imidazole-4-carboxamide isomerase [Candidatus Omnitrophota bacterium]|jgi:phosphoribosylformimino-5-aminoimidazole carboxamide ribotide isomerase
MLLIPAIDIKDGKVVRLTQGRFDKTINVYADEPVVVAKKWAAQGASLIHIVDLDGAALGRPRNLDKVKQIIETIKTPVEFGGGVRTIDTIKELLEAGVSRVILGTKAVEDRNFLEDAFKRFKNKVIVSIDAKSGHILTKGWKESFEGVEVLEFARQLKSLGFTELIYTDILKDGTLKGPNIEAISVLLKKVGIGVVASGGISNLADISRLKSLEKEGLTGVIVGKALYEGKFTLQEALRLA